MPLRLDLEVAQHRTPAKLWKIVGVLATVDDDLVTATCCAIERKEASSSERSALPGFR